MVIFGSKVMTKIRTMQKTLQRFFLNCKKMQTEIFAFCVVLNATNIILYFYLSMKTNLKRRILKQNCWNFLYCQKQTVKSSHKMESFTTSQWDCHLLHQKVHQRISVMKTNTLYLSRELCFFVVFKTKCKLKSQFPGNIECVCFHYWDSLMNFLM